MIKSGLILLGEHRESGELSSRLKTQSNDGKRGSLTLIGVSTAREHKRFIQVKRLVPRLEGLLKASEAEEKIIQQIRREQQQEQ